MAATRKERYPLLFSFHPNKGKQGTKGQKQIVEENKETLKFYIYVITAVNVLYFLTSLVFFSDAFSFGVIVLLVMTTSTYAGSYYFMRYMARPTYDNATGALLDSGSDLNMEQGVAEHVKDLLLLTAIVQTLSLISNYFWLLLLLLPTRVFHLLWINILGPWFFAEAPAVDEKKQKKMERKMKRR